MMMLLLVTGRSWIVMGAQLCVALVDGASLDFAN